MKKSEERALKKYPVVWSYNDYAQEEEDMNREARWGFEEGYEEAERDNELTWEDMKKIVNIADKILDCGKEAFKMKYLTEQAYYEDILNLFKKEKEAIDKKDK